MNQLDLQYPIGRCKPKTQLTAVERSIFIEDIAALPRDLRDAVEHLGDAQLDTPYRPGGWSIRQVIHHLPDSHMNAFIRFKLALTEDNPTIRPYDQDGWSQLADAVSPDIETSLLLLDTLHRRWVYLLRSMDEAQWQRKLTHPETGVQTLVRMLQLYAWHGRHHLAHVTTVLRAAEG